MFAVKELKYKHCYILEEHNCTGNRVRGKFSTFFILSVGLWNAKLGAWSTGIKQNIRIWNKTNTMCTPDIIKSKKKIM
jgi:hypothetical protein